MSSNKHDAFDQPTVPPPTYNQVTSSSSDKSSNKPYAFNPPAVVEPPPTYNQVCVTSIVPSSKFITLAGQTGLRMNHSIPSGIPAQAKGAYESIQKCLAAVGATPRDIVCFPSSPSSSQGRTGGFAVTDYVCDSDTCSALCRRREQRPRAESKRHCRSRLG